MIEQNGVFITVYYIPFIIIHNIQNVLASRSGWIPCVYSELATFRKLFRVTVDSFYFT